MVPARRAWRAGLWTLLAGAALAPASLAAQAPGPRTIVVDTVLVEGNERLTDPIVISTFGIQSGQEISGRDIQAATKNLWSTGHFADVRVLVRGIQGQPALLILQVEEQPILRTIRFEGLEHADAGEVQDSTGILPGAPYSPVAVAEAIAIIRAELAGEGIPFARIDESRNEVPGVAGQIDLVFDVDEGNRVTVAEIVFDGNTALSDEALIAGMQTKPEGFWWFRGGSFDQTSYEADITGSLGNVYDSNGYLDFRILSDTVEVDPQTGKARIRIAVEEGERYEVRDFTIEGNRRFQTEQLESYFSQEARGLLASLGIGGEDADRRYFDAVAFQGATDRVSELYRNEGYLYANITPFMQTHPAEGDAPPGVSIGWQIEEGNPAYVNRVEIAGNDFTYDQVIRERIYLLPGDVYSEARLLQSWQQISALGFFETPPDPPSIEPTETGDVDIIFNVTERQTGSVSFGTSVGGGVGVNGFLGYDQPNLFGQGKSGSLRWDFGSYINNFTLSYSDPAIRGSRVSGTISVFNARNRFFTFSGGRYKRLGTSVRVGLPVPNALRSRVFVGYSITRTKYDEFDNAQDASLFGLPDGVLSTFTLGFTRETLNHPLFPTSGSRQSLNSAFSGGLLGGAGNFSKHTAEATWYVPAGQLGDGPGGIRFALGLSAKAGAVVGDASRFPFERFFMGGVQFGENLRGYDETTITPFGFVGRNAGGFQDISRVGDAFLSMTAEYAIRFNDNLSVSAFYDAGGVWTEPSQIDPTRLFRGAGVGVQIVTPFGPLGLDYAYGFDKTEPGWKLHFRLAGGPF